MLALILVLSLTRGPLEAGTPPAVDTLQTEAGDDLETESGDALEVE